MIKNINRNVSVWRGNNAPPTDYHVWLKDDGTGLIKIINDDGTEEWKIFSNPHVGDEINFTSLTGDEFTLETLLTELQNYPELVLHDGVKIRFKDSDLNKWVTYIFKGGDINDSQNWQLTETEDGEEHLGDLIDQLDGEVIKIIGVGENEEELTPDDEGKVVIPQATKQDDGVLSKVDKTFVDGVRDGNLALPNPHITGTWTFYSNGGTTVNDSEISPVPNSRNPILENGYKASFSGTYKWTSETGKKDPTSVEGSSNWSDLPESDTNSSTYTSPQLTTNTTIKIGICADKTGLMVGSNGKDVLPAQGVDTTRDSVFVQFQHRRFWGVLNTNTPSETDIEGLQNELSTSRACTKNSITATPQQWFIYAYPKSLGNLTTIIQDGATPVLGAFTQSEL